MNKTIGLSYESRDPVVIVAKRVAREVPLFKGRVNELTNSLSRRSAHVITMNTLVAANTDLLLARYRAANADTLRKQPAIAQLARKPITSPEVGMEAEPLVTFWAAVIGNTPGWDRVMLDEDQVDRLTAGEVREGIYADNGQTLMAPGHVSAYGIGWQAIAKAMAALVRWKADPTSAKVPLLADPLAALVDCIQKVDWRRGKHWNGSRWSAPG
ncbi:DNA sulfur modification protein DndB [Dankookia sp. P2]|uniref:DNA sulfur modification protein DndB n=1 Tax=Dankookia sp. P2 TaxID=3423955 RepID=UPI003D671CA6